ncbi:MAG: GNAT family N-acetyltransferase [Kiloniellaceae bacterium]
MNATIRPALPEDRSRIEAIVDAAYSPYLQRMNRKPAPMVDDYARRIADGQALVLEAGGAVAGILVLEAHPDDHDGFLLLDNIAVDPAFHGRGLGKRLMAFTEEEARRQGYDTVVLYTNEVMVENIALYQRLGYVETERQQVGGYDRVYLRKKI